MQHRGSTAKLAERMQAECIGMRVGRLHRIMARHFDQALGPLGLSMSQMEILSALVLFGEPVKPAVLAERLGAERSTMSRNLSLMEQRGWVAAGQVSPSGRSMTITITDAGIGVLADAKDAWTEAQAAATSLLGSDALETLDAWLDAMSDPLRSQDATTPSP